MGPQSWTQLSARTEKAMAPHSSTLAWKIPWMEEPGRLQSIGSLRVGHNWVTSLSLFTFMHWRRKWQPTPVCLPRESQGQGGLVCYSPWGCKESDMTERLNWTEAVTESTLSRKYHDLICFAVLNITKPGMFGFEHFLGSLGGMVFENRGRTTIDVNLIFNLLKLCFIWN